MEAEYLLKITELEAKVRFLEKIVQEVSCKQCGLVSWDVPLADYCTCQQRRKPDRLDHLANADID